MTPEEKAQEAADALAALEAASAAAFEKVMGFLNAVPVGPITKRAFRGRLRGIDGDICQLHVDLVPFDPRPRPRDGGGK